MEPIPDNALQKNLHSIIDHTLLKPALSEPDIARICNEAVEYGFHAVCLYPCWIRSASSCLAELDVRVCSVVGFPSGTSHTRVKQLEAEMAIHDGATELDLVANLGWLRNGDWSRFADQVKAVRAVASNDFTLKVIIESSTLSNERRREATKVLIDCGVDYVKTGTGLEAAVTPDEVSVLKQAAGAAIKIKASGGIKTPDQCRDLIRAGADRLGTSSSVQIMRGLKSPA